jgi:WD40 repeat protein
MKRVLAQHQGAILKLKANINARARAMSIAFKDDSSQVVSSFHDGTIKVWDAGYQKRQLNPAPPLASDALSVRLAASLELKTEKQNAHSDWIKSVAFSPDGKTIVSGSDDKTIKVWGELPFLASTTQPPPDSCLPAHRCVLPGYGRREDECAQRPRAQRQF